MYKIISVYLRSVFKHFALHLNYITVFEKSKYQSLAFAPILQFVHMLKFLSIAKKRIMM